MAPTTTVVDVHNHVFDRALFEFINGETGGSVPLREDAARLLWDVWVDLTDIDERIAMVEDSAIDKQVISYSGIENFVDPSHFQANPDARVTIGRRINDRYAALVERRPDLFAAFADVPLVGDRNVDAAIAELERAVGDLGCVGVTLNPNYGGIRLDDPRLDPLLETVADLDVPVFMHPANPAGLDAMRDIPILSYAVGYPTETALAAERLVLSGRLDEYDLDNLAPDAGGSLPYRVYRLGLVVDEEVPIIQGRTDFRATLDRRPIDYFRSNFYFDTGLSNGHQYEFTLREIGDQVVFGTDYPYFPSGQFDRMWGFIDELELPGEREETLYHGNAKAIGIA